MSSSSVQRTRLVNAKFGDTAIANKLHPEEAALFCAAVSKDGYAHSLVPSFETHRLSDAPQILWVVGGQEVRIGL